MNLLEKCSRSFSLWLMKMAYRGMNEAEKLQAQNDATLRIRHLRMDFDFELADMWVDFYIWTTTYKD